ncbi:MAG: class I SAM-dependent methyltransferase [Amaricoccus sp.]
MTAQAPDRAHWTRVARQWIAWARTPGHDAFWSYRAGLRAFLGPGEGSAIEVGCGEGRVSRLLGELGWRVTATDPVAELLAAARESQSAEAYAIAPASALPFEDGRFDLAVAYNMLMDVADVPGALAELRRVLRPDGALVLSIVHPLADLVQAAGANGALGDQPYFERRRFEATEARDGISMEFAGWSQPIEAYALALEGAGFTIAALREPRPDPGADARLDRWRRLPLFLWLKARPVEGPW